MDKEMKIIPPEGYIVDRENSTFEHIKFKPITYKDIERELFFNKKSFKIVNKNIYSYSETINYQDELIAKSARQLKRLFAMNQLMNVAEYLNGDWKPDWNNIDDFKYTISYCTTDKELIISNTCTLKDSIVYFKSEDTAQHAIDILGEDTIKLIFSTT